MSFYFKLKQLRENPETSLAGTKWTDDEEKCLLESIADENKTIEEIAIEHKRTPGGIISRLKQVAVKMVINDGIDINEVSKSLRVSVDDINTSLNKRNQSKLISQSFAQHNLEYSILEEIRDLLVKIEAKIN